MLRSLAVAALLAIPMPASASIGDGGVPLRTLCSSPTMDYCMSIWTWDFEWRLTGTFGGELSGTPAYYLSGHSTIETFGAGFDALEEEYRMVFFITSPALGITYTDPLRRRTGAGIIDLFVDDGPFYDITGPSTAHNLTAVMWPDSRCTTAEWPHEFGAGPACYEPASVPEPASLLLLASGGLGLAWVRRRRAA